MWYRYSLHSPLQDVDLHLIELAFIVSLWNRTPGICGKVFQHRTLPTELSSTRSWLEVVSRNATKQLCVIFSGASRCGEYAMDARMRAVAGIIQVLQLHGCGPLREL